MPKRSLAGLWVLLCAIGAYAQPAAASLTTSIDLDYTYTQDNDAGDVFATVGFNQKYEIRYETSLTSVYDFVGALRFDLVDTWASKAATTSSVAPSLEVQIVGAELTWNTVYEGTIATTEAYRELGETTIYSNSLSSTLAWTPTVLPEITLRYKHQRGYQPWLADSNSESIDVTVVKDYKALRLEFNLSQIRLRTILPNAAGTDSITWSGKATYKEVLWGGTEFELAYGIDESYSESESLGVYSSATETYVQSLRSRLKNSLTLAPRMTLGLSWEYQFDQDLLELSYDYKFKNRYQIELRWDMTNWLKFIGDARRETESKVAIVGEDDTRTLNDSVRFGFESTLIKWFRIAGKGEVKQVQSVRDLSGGSVNVTQDEKYDITGRNRFGEFWDLTLSASTATKRDEGWVTNRDTRLKATLALKIMDVSVTPSYELSRVNQWDWGGEEPRRQQRIRDAKLDFSYVAKLLDLFQATFTHQYGMKIEDTLDQVLDFESVLQFSENTKINVVIAEIVRDLRLEGEVERRATDTENDPDPTLVEVAYRLRLDWRLSDLSLGSSLTYNDKGDAFDDMAFNTRISWKTDQLDVSSEYEFSKIFADQTSEKRRLNLRLNYRF